MRSLARVVGNPELRRVELAFVIFNAAEWGTWIAMLVFAYGRGGATTAGLVALAQLVPAGLFAPVAARLGERFAPGRVLAAGYGAQALAMGATGVVLLAGVAAPIAYVLAAVAASVVTITRPAQAALMPSLARTAEDLTAANVVSGWVESVSVLAAPAAAGVLLGAGSPGLVFAAMGSLALLGGALVVSIRGPTPAHAIADDSRAARLRDEPDAQFLVAVLAGQYVAIGALDVLFVVIAVEVLGRGGDWAGYLNAAFGAGGVAAIVVTVRLVGRPRLAPPLLAGLVVWAVAFAVLAVGPGATGSLALIAVAGAGRTILDVAGRTLLQRAVPLGLVSRAFGVLEGVSMAGLAAGSLLAPALVALGGARAALVGLTLLLPLGAVCGAVRLRSIDRGAHSPIVELALLRSLPLFAPLSAPLLEGLARSLVPLEVEAGTEVIRRGDPGDRFYVIAEGELEVTGHRAIGRGEGFGELALLADVPRTATVVARTPARLFALERDAFLTAVTGHPGSAREGARLVAERLPVAP